MKYELNRVYNEDCVEAMKQMPDNYFDLAIVDPPYAHNSGNAFTSRLKRYGDLSFNDRPPPPEYFTELFRVSENQIIWGGNYFLDYLGKTKCMITWCKHQPVKTYANSEIAWTSFQNEHSHVLDLPYFGAHGRDSDRIHPNQKPVKLYAALAERYATPKSKILDTHGGSLSSALAYIDFGCDFMAFESDLKYYTEAIARINNHIIQPKADFDQTEKTYSQLTI